MINLGAGDTLAGTATALNTVTYTITGLEVLSPANTETYKRLVGPAQLPNTVTVLYTVPALTSAFIKTIHLQNTVTTAQSISFYINSPTAVAANLLKTLIIPANGSAIFNQEGWEVYDINGALLTTTTTATASKNYSARVFARNRWR